MSWLTEDMYKLYTLMFWAEIDRLLWQYMIKMSVDVQMSLHIDTSQIRCNLNTDL